MSVFRYRIRGWVIVAGTAALFAPASYLQGQSTRDRRRLLLARGPRRLLIRRAGHGHDPEEQQPAQYRAARRKLGGAVRRRSPMDARLQGHAGEKMDRGGKRSARDPGAVSQVRSGLGGTRLYARE